MGLGWGWGWGWRRCGRPGAMLSCCGLGGELAGRGRGLLRRERLGSAGRGVVGRGGARWGEGGGAGGGAWVVRRGWCGVGGGAVAGHGAAGLPGRGWGLGLGLGLDGG